MTAVAVTGDASPSSQDAEQFMRQVQARAVELMTEGQRAQYARGDEVALKPAQVGTLLGVTPRQVSRIEQLTAHAVTDPDDDSRRRYLLGDVVKVAWERVVRPPRSLAGSRNVQRRWQRGNRNAQSQYQRLAELGRQGIRPQGSGASA